METNVVTNKLIQLKDANSNPLYPKILSESIPNGSVTKVQLDDQVKQKIDGIVITLNYSGHPGEYEVGESSLSSPSDLETYYNAYRQGVNIYFVIDSVGHGHGFNTSSTNYLPVYEFGYDSRRGYTLMAKNDLFIYTANSIDESPYLTVTTSAITAEPKDFSITTDKILNRAVTKEKLSKDVLEDITSITWNELKQLRDGNNLLPGHQYRITDYQCTTTQENTQSAGHQFDIIVTADSINKLNEKARACLHDGDTYFENSNLAAWQLWYSLDNDIERFAWANDSLGYGVIYRMIDEYNNDCPYDFKNIQFKRYKITKSKSSGLVGTYLATEANSDIGLEIDNNDSKMFYTFSYLGRLRQQEEILKDASIIGNTLQSNDESPYGVYGNTIKYYFNSSIENLKPIQSLNNIVFLTYSSGDIYYGCYSNLFDINCSINSFDNGCRSNSFGDMCQGNSFGNKCSINLFGLYSSNIKLNAYYTHNTFDHGVSYVTFDGDGTESNYIQNYHIKQSMVFDKGSEYTIIAKPGLNYELSVAKKSDGTVVEYNEADTHKLVSITDQDYAALTTKDSNTVYCIPEQ